MNTQQVLSKNARGAFCSNGQKINTFFVERVNLTLCRLVSRLHRKTLCFSKKREYLVYHLHQRMSHGGRVA